MIAKIAFRNIWRSKFRSLIVILAFVFGISGAVFLNAFFMSFGVEMVNSSVRYQVSHVQIHNPKYLENQDIEFSFDSKDGSLHFFCLSSPTR